MRTATLVVLVALPTAVFASPPEVAVVQPVVREITDSADFTGRVEASATVHLRPRVPGLLEKVLFKEGAEVKKGDVLFQIDDRLPRAELAKAEAELARAEAGLKLAEADWKRLMKIDVGQEELERARNIVEQAKAGIEAAKAGVQSARIVVEYTRITAPIAGKIGRRMVDEGNVVQADTILAVIVAIDPVYVTFEVDERTFLRLQKERDEPRTIGVAFGDEQDYPHKATPDMVDNRVDPQHGTIHMRSKLANPRGEIYPGLFARVRVPLGKLRKALLVPESAVALYSLPGGGVKRVAFVLDAKNRLTEREVGTGQTVGSLRVVERGLAEGDWIARDIQNRRTGRPAEEITPVKQSATDKLPIAPYRLDDTPSKPLADLPGNGPAVVVTATYPGATAQVVDETVAAPIDQQLNGLDGVISRVRTCTDAGEMRLTILLKPGTDLNQAQLLVQKRVGQAEPVLPDVVRTQGVKILKRGTHLLAIALTSPNGTYDRTYLGRYVEIQVREELARVSGVATVASYGDSSPVTQARVAIDPDKLAARNLTVADVTDALRQQNLTATAAPGKLRTEPMLNLGGLRLTELDELGQVILRATKDGRLVYLRDVARIELGAGWSTTTVVDDKPAAILLISRLPDAIAGEAEKAVRKRLAELRKQLPVGLEVKVLGE